MTVRFDEVEGKRALTLGVMPVFLVRLASLYIA